MNVLSTEERALRAVDFSVRVLDYHQRGGKGSRPKEPKHPPYADEARAEDAKVRRKAEAFLRRQQRKSG